MQPDSLPVDDAIHCILLASLGLARLSELNPIQVNFSSYLDAMWYYVFIEKKMG